MTRPSCNNTEGQVTNAPPTSTSVATIGFKIADLKRDAESVKVTYDSAGDRNKPRIERVLSNMKRKILKAEQIVKFGQHVTRYCVTQNKTRVLMERVYTMKRLFNDLKQDQCFMAKQDRRSLCEMFHQLLSMEDDLAHFTEPIHDHRTVQATKCKSNEEPYWTSIKDSQVQADGNFDGGSSHPEESNPLIYTGIGWCHTHEIPDILSTLLSVQDNELMTLCMKTDMETDPTAIEASCSICEEHGISPRPSTCADRLAVTPIKPGNESATNCELSNELINTNNDPLKSDRAVESTVPHTEGVFPIDRINSPLKFEGPLRMVCKDEKWKDASEKVSV